MDTDGPVVTMDVSLQFEDNPLIHIYSNEAEITDLTRPECIQQPNV